MAKVKKSGELTNVRRAPAAGGRQARTGVRSGGAGGARPKAGKQSPAKSGSKRSPSKPAAKATARGTAKRGATPASKRVKRVAKRAAKPAGKRVAKKAARSGSAPARKRPGAKATPVAVAQIKVRELNPQEKCGAGTSVERLIRVDEIMNKALQAHLVFFDRHGWYCEHGRTCPAVGHARRHARQDRNARNGTYNGRMRA